MKTLSLAVGTRLTPVPSSQFAAVCQLPPAAFVHETSVTAPGVVTARQAENSEVLPAGSVAVAVADSPAVVAAASVALIAALPEASVVTSAKPRKVRPS